MICPHDLNINQNTAAVYIFKMLLLVSLLTHHYHVNIMYSVPAIGEAWD